MSVAVGMTVTMMVITVLPVITSVVVRVVMGVIHQGNIMRRVAVTLSHEFRYTLALRECHEDQAATAIAAGASILSTTDTSGSSQKAQMPDPMTSKLAATMNGACHDPY